MANSSLRKKLRLPPGEPILILNPPQGYIESLGELPEGTTIAIQAQGQFNFVHLFVKDSREFDKLNPMALKALEYDGTFWISYPKRSSKVETDLSRDVFWDLLTEAGLRPVSQVSIDDTWSAIRFRPSELVGK